MKKSPVKQKNGKKDENNELKNIGPSPEELKIQAIHDNFHKNIQIPLQSIEAIQHSKTPQRCLQHNTIFTLYCEFDRKPLCASCMYQVDTHRKHRVIPIGRSMALIKQDMTAFSIRLQENIQQCSTVCVRLQESIIKNQNFYPSVIKQLKKYYQNLTQLLKQKQKQQIEKINQLHKKLQNEIMYLDRQIKHIMSVIKTRLKVIQIKDNQQVLLSRRNTFEILSKVNKIIHNEIADVFVDEQANNIINFNTFNDVYEVVRNKLIITLPGAIIIPRSKVYSSPHKVQRISPQNLKVKCKDDIQKVNSNRPLSKSKSPNTKQQKKVKFKFQT